MQTILPMIKKTSVISLAILGLIPAACSMHQPLAKVHYKGDLFYAKNGVQEKSSTQSPHRLTRMSAASMNAYAPASGGNREWQDTADSGNGWVMDEGFAGGYEPAAQDSYSVGSGMISSSSLPEISASSSYAPAPSYAPSPMMQAPMPLLGGGDYRPLSAAPAPVFSWPVNGKILEQYGRDASGKFNDGINIASYPGEPVRAAATGSVAYVGDQLEGYGQMIILRHNNGYITAYAHLSEPLVGRGDHVSSGEVIGRAGNSGSVHNAQVHFSIRKDKDPVNPEPLLARQGHAHMVTAELR